MPSDILIRIRFDRVLDVDEAARAAETFAEQLAPAIVDGKAIPAATGPGPERIQGAWGYGRARAVAVEPLA